MTERAMPRGVARVLLVCLCMTLISTAAAITGVGLGTAKASVDGKYYLTGSPQDQAQKPACHAGPPAPCTRPSFSKTAPTGTTPIAQTASGSCVTNAVTNVHCSYWSGPYSGTLDGPIEFCWWWSTENAGAIALGATVDVILFADPNYSAGSTQQPEKIIATAKVPITVTPQPTMNVSTITVNNKTVNKELLIQVDGEFSDADAQLTTHYGATSTLSAFGPPGTACPGGATPTASASSTKPPTSTPTQTPTATPTQTPTATPTPSPTPTGGKLPSPGARIKFSDPTPKKGEVTVATASLKKCPGHAGTKIQLQQKKGAKFKKVASKKLNKKCKAKFQVKANFDKATFRSYWAKQDADHRAGKSRPKTVRTH